jgi:O-antigen ligase
VSRTVLRRHLGLAQIVVVVVCLPPLFFPERAPQWVIWASLLILALTLVVGHLVTARSLIRTPVDISILLLLLMLPITLLVTPDRELTLSHVYKVIGSVALFYSIVEFLEEKPWFRLTSLSIIAIGLVLTAFVLLSTDWSKKLVQMPFDIYELFPQAVRPFWNPEGFNSNIAGGTLAMLLPIPITYALFERKLPLRLGAAVAVVMMGGVLLLTQSRGAISALLVGIAAMMVSEDRRWLVVGLLLVIAGVLVFQFSSVDNLAATEPGAVERTVHSAQGRLELWSRGLMMLQDFVFTGIGFGMVVEVMPLLYPTFTVPNDAGLEHVHNLYLEAGVDLGFPGLIVTLALVLGLLHLSWDATQRARGTSLKPLASAMLGTVVVFATHGITDNITFYAKAHVITWALFGVAVAVAMYLLRYDRRARVLGASGQV